MLKRVKKLWSIIKYFFTDEDNLLLHLIEMKAYETLDDCFKLDVGMTEEIEDLIFHIKAYYDIPENLIATRYPCYKGESISSITKNYKNKKCNMIEVINYTEYLTEVEKQRAIERDIIFEYAKILCFGFKL